MRKLEGVQKLGENREKMLPGKAEDVIISFAAVTVIIIADICRALAVCQALSPELYTLT